MSRLGGSQDHAMEYEALSEPKCFQAEDSLLLQEGLEQWVKVEAEQRRSDGPEESPHQKEGRLEAKGLLWGHWPLGGANSS